MVYSVTYDVICTLCKKIAWHGEIGEYPYSWQFSICPHCGGSAVPDLEHPTEHRLTMRAPDFSKAVVKSQPKRRKSKVCSPAKGE